MSGKKGAGADLLLEIIISSIIFFVVTALLFGYFAEKAKLQAEATVVSADASLNCETSLVNLLRGPNKEGITYGDWAVYSYFAGDMSEWKANVTEIFDRAFGQSWNLSVSLPNGTEIASVGYSPLEGPNIDVFTCTAYVPFPAAYTNISCWSPLINHTENGKEVEGNKVEISEESELVEFQTPDGDISCEAIFDKGDEGEIGIETGNENCPLDLKGKSLYGENLPSEILNTEELDSITLPIKIFGASYEITVNETEEKKKAEVILEKSATLPNCALRIDFATTNVSVIETKTAVE